ncbi:MAG TPA: cupin domain-containing protein [Solirubrobacteraceae bacterium]
MTIQAPHTLSLEPDGAIPNSPLPVLVYHGVELAGDPGRAEAAFASNGWWGSWRNGIYPFHHFHSTAHEVLAIVAGQASVALGGPDGQTVTLQHGDVVVLPAGTGHCRRDASDDLLVVGAYPEGMDWDLRRGDPGEHDEVMANIAAVPLPGSDPVHGPGGPLTALWRSEA